MLSSALRVNTFWNSPPISLAKELKKNKKVFPDFGDPFKGELHSGHYRPPPEHGLARIAVLQHWL